MHAELRLPHIFTDHAVLQRNVPIHVWGWDIPHQGVELRFHGQMTSTTADENGRWSAWLEPEQAGGPYSLDVRGSTSLLLTDILVGDVWIASGQSNMEMPLSGFDSSQVVTGGQDAIAQAQPTNIRLFHVPRHSSEFPQTDTVAQWSLTTTETLRSFSAIGYFFAQFLAQDQGIPIGIVEAAYGGTPIEAWMSLDGIAANPAFMPVFRWRDTFTESQPDLDTILERERTEDVDARAAGLPPPIHPGHYTTQSSLPAGLFNGMIAPLTGYSMCGVIWYQGESNAPSEKVSLYGQLMQALVENWRNRWQIGEFPFLYVQLSSWKTNLDWGSIRDAQRRALSVARTAMVVTYDIGDAKTIHPADKRTVAERLSLAARGLVYGEKLEWCGPIYRQRTIEPHAVRVWFDHAEDLHASTGNLTGFELAAADGEFVPADAKVQGSSVIVSAPNIAAPVRVRYAWASMTSANLVNHSGLPAPTFITEEPGP